MTIITIELICPFCGRTHYVPVDEEQFFNWYYGDEPIQSAMPNLSATEREQLISNICPNCQEEIFK